MPLRLLLALLLVAPSFAAAATLMVFGDSLSAAYGLQRDQGWTTLLQRRLDERKLDYKVTNTSISGETTSGGRSRIDAALKTHRPAIVIIALGANDGLRGLSVEAMHANLDAMVRAFKVTRAIMDSPVVAPHRGKELFTANVENDDEIRAILRRRSDTIYHPVSTCRMGVDEFAVVDSQLRVRGVDGLRVVDASIMPTLIGGNTNAPTIMIAEKAGDLIRAAG